MRRGDSDTGRLTDSVAVVTGGSSGIGKQIALDMARLGAHVVIASHDVARLRDAEAELREVASDSIAVNCDVSSAEDVSRLAAVVLGKFGRVDVLVNNAGYAVYRTFEEMDASEICRLVEVNLLGAMRCTKAFLPAMIERRDGTIINMASIAGRIPLTPNGVYCASKHGLVALSQTLRQELARYNIKVHVVCPGRAETAFFDHETFRARRSRPETRYTVSVKDISRATLRVIGTRTFMVYVPRTIGLLAWALNGIPWLTRPVFDRLIAARVRSYYEARGGSDGDHGSRS